MTSAWDRSRSRRRLALLVPVAAAFMAFTHAQPIEHGPLVVTQSVASPTASPLESNDRFTAADDLPLATTAAPLVTLLTDEQLKAIGIKVTEKAASATADDDGDDHGPAHKPKQSSASPAADDPTSASPSVLTGSAATDVSIDHVEAHLHILQELELSVARSIKALNDRNGNGGDVKAVDLFTLNLELQNVQKNLKRLAEGLSGTLEDLEVVEKDTQAKAKKLEAVLEIQQEEKEEQFIEENGIKEVDYETGHLRNATKLKLSRAHRDKIEAAEKKVDPAVLHYDFELLGQIAILLGVSAIGGIVATYFHIPPNIGYLLGGALVGPSCLMIVKQFKEVETISLFGSIFLLFGHGAAYTPQQIDRLGFKKYLWMGVAYIVGTVLLVALVSVYLGWSASFSEGITVGIAVSFTTTAPLYEHIRANQIQDTSYGRTLIAIIAVQDILMSFALGTPEWFSVRSVGFVGIAAVRSIIAYAVVVVLTMGLHLHVVPRLLAFLTAMEQIHHSPLLLLGVVSVCLFMALFTELIGLSLECGAFLAGLAFVNVSRDAQGAFTSIRVMENLFGSMFFACVGMILNPMFLLKNAGEILSMVILIVVIKACSMTVVMAANRVVSIDKALLAGVGLCQVGELALIFIIKAHATKLVSRRIYLLFVAAIAVFLGCSSIFNRQVVLSRRKKTVFRLPTIMSRRRAQPPNGGGGGLTRDGGNANGDDERNRGSSDAAAPISPPSTPRERRAMHKTTPSMGMH